MKSIKERRDAWCTATADAEDSMDEEEEESEVIDEDRPL
jgi:hypothetical protein